MTTCEAQWQRVCHEGRIGREGNSKKKKKKREKEAERQAFRREARREMCPVLYDSTKTKKGKGWQVTECLRVSSHV